MSEKMSLPNIILITCDDLAWGDLSFHGNPWVKTPRLDTLAKQSARLTRYCSGPLCTPARAALMTGRYPYRTRAIDTYLGRSMLDPDEVTLARWLIQAGYYTGIFGKWHLGDCYPMRAIDHGFNEALVHAGGGLRQHGNPTLNNGYFDADLLNKDKLIKSSGYCTDVFTDAAIDFLCKTTTQPFFLYLATNAPHTPLEIADCWAEECRNEKLPEQWARIYGMVANIDWNIGRVLDYLDSENLKDNTIVIFTSDHGPCGSTVIEGKSRYNGGMRGIKGQMYEGGIRVPCFWRWPKRFIEGNVSRLASPIDVMPTLAGACKIPLPTDVVIDGVDLHQLLTHEEDCLESENRHVYMQWHRGDIPVRYRNAAVIGPRYKFYQPHESMAIELYDLQDDPIEEHNIAIDKPEICQNLKQKYEEWFNDVSSTRQNNYMPPRIHLGSKNQPWVPLTRQDWRTQTGEGWSDDDEGFWLVNVESIGPYRFTVHFSSVESNTQLHVQIGEMQLKSNLIPGDQSYTYTNLLLPTAVQNICAWLVDNKARRGVRQLDVVLESYYR